MQRRIVKIHNKSMKGLFKVSRASERSYPVLGVINPVVNYEIPNTIYLYLYVENKEKF